VAKIGPDIPITRENGMDEDDDDFVPQEKPSYRANTSRQQSRKDVTLSNQSSGESSGDEFEPIEVDAEGHEIVREVPNKSRSVVAKKTLSTGASGAPAKRRKPPQIGKKNARASNDEDETHEFVFEESDGEGALRGVREAEAEDEAKRLSRRGPRTVARAHFHPPKAALGIKGEKRWSFKCRYCSVYVFGRVSMQDADYLSLTSEITVKRSKDGISFDDEPKRPHIGNLGTHTKEAHPEQHQQGRQLAAAGHHDGTLRHGSRPQCRIYRVECMVVMAQPSKDPSPTLSISMPSSQKLKKGFTPPLLLWSWRITCPGILRKGQESRESSPS
jgi:hypothetical protein